ncbi:MAG: hypothetical protein HKO75_09540 [Flavobacteriaceae bacterium]|nr:hypothetical protein [Muriicola sp.]NNC62984.1 hypothetical protein [Eudoraea sp.]NNK21567.1 hypothetical protein [Flavobacteriaceae bacterium]MBT8291131.1 hypothetical protein [Muriicola sp.]NNK36330.1 hypothetical protein [Eudoraea sp.]
MKTQNQLRSLFCFVFLLISISLFSQKDNSVDIILTVDVSQLGDDPNDPGGCTFMAEPNAVVLENLNAKDFTIGVESGKKLKWIGRTTDGDVVKILKIYYLSGTNIFNKSNLRRCLFGKKVRNKVRRSTEANMDYTYGVKFKVKKKGRYYLDPKIRVE